MTAPAEWVGVLEQIRTGYAAGPCTVAHDKVRALDAAIAALRAQQEPAEAPVVWAKRQMVVGAGCGVEGVLHIDGSVQDDEVPLYAQSTISKVSALLDVAMTTLRQIESTPRNAGARRNARATVRFIETLLAALYAAPPATPEPKR